MGKRYLLLQRMKRANRHLEVSDLRTENNQVDMGPFRDDDEKYSLWHIMIGSA